MKKGKFEFTVLSAYDRKNLTCEICYEKEIVAEITHEADEHILEIYPPQLEKYWEIPLADFQEALEFAKNYLPDCC